MHGLGSALNPSFSPSLPSLEHGTRYEHCWQQSTQSPAVLNALASRTCCPRAEWRCWGELHTPGHVWGSTRKIHVSWVHEAIV